jgi:hypothetical protein
MQSSTFLKDIAYNIELDQLYELIDTCHRSDMFNFCPVLLEIKSDLLKSHFGGNFLLQVWQHGGKRLFEKVLKNKVKAWCSSEGDTLTYKPPPGDEDSDCIYIVYVFYNFVMRVRDPVNDPTFVNIYFNNGALFMANQSTIKFWKIPQPQVKKDSISDIFETKAD